MLIGLVLNAPPGYSETFITSKIRLLSESGARIIVFANHPLPERLDYEFIEGYGSSGTFFTKCVRAAKALGLMLRSPLRSIKFFRLNRLSGRTPVQNLKSLFLSAHILRFHLDWLHFGFATAALGKENLAAAIGARMAVSVRGFDIAVYPLKNPGCYEPLWQRVDKLHYLSDAVLRRAVSHGFDIDRPHQKISPAVAAERFAVASRTFDEEKLRIITVARLHWIKGIEYTLEALRLVKESGADFQYTIVGEGGEHERLAFAAHQLGIEEYVCFAGRLSPDDTAKALAGGTVYVQYSLDEGFCNAVIEAQAAGLLTVVSDAGALPENVVHGATGWVVPKRRPDLLAERLLKICKLSKQERDRISRGGVERARSLFDLENQRERWLEFYA